MSCRTICTLNLTKPVEAPSPRSFYSKLSCPRPPGVHLSVITRNARKARCVADVTPAQVSSKETQAACQERIDLEVEVISSIEQVSAEEWDACAVAGGEVNPFLLHAFLLALEASGSAVAHTGWLPQHVLARDAASGQLLGCVPMYLKTHSYGEYVFDHSWASTYARLGRRYYPKLQCCVPFTPVTGQRLLIIEGPHKAAVGQALAQTLMQVADELGVSSLHITFNSQAEWTALRRNGFLSRTGIQYHWDNPGFTSFDDFLMQLKQSKRKNIRQERRKVSDEGIEVQRLRGADIKATHWDAFYSFYLNTVDRKWGSAYLTREFFQLLGESMSEQVLLVVGRDKGGTSRDAIMSGALNLVGSSALFGRNWGCRHGRAIKNLHFELCYYQAIEAAIELGLSRVEAGAQGEHKIQRGYRPCMTYSSHYIRDPQLRGAVERFLKMENAQVEYALEALTQEASPYKD